MGNGGWAGLAGLACMAGAGAGVFMASAFPLSPALLGQGPLGLGGCAAARQGRPSPFAAAAVALRLLVAVLCCWFVAVCCLVRQDVRLSGQSAAWPTFVSLGHKVTRRFKAISGWAQGLQVHWGVAWAFPFNIRSSRLSSLASFLGWQGLSLSARCLLIVSQIGLRSFV